MRDEVRPCSGGAASLLGDTKGREWKKAQGGVPSLDWVCVLAAFSLFSTKMHLTYLSSCLISSFKLIVYPILK